MEMDKMDKDEYYQRQLLYILDQIKFKIFTMDDIPQEELRQMIIESLEYLEKKKILEEMQRINE